MLAETKEFVKGHFYDIMLIIVVSLLILLSFAVGFIIAKYQDKGQVEIKQAKTN